MSEWHEADADDDLFEDADNDNGWGSADCIEQIDTFEEEETYETVDFSNTSTNCGNGCKSKQRMLHAIKYYQSVNMTDKQSEDALIDFYKHTYIGFLNDFIHVITNHTHEMDEIYDSLSPCNMQTCTCSSRHNRNRHNDCNASKSCSHEELEYAFIRDLFDGVHCYILHGYDFGYRIHRKELKQEINIQTSENEISCKDKAFFRFAKIIENKKQALGVIPRFKKNNKYIIDTVKNELLSDMYVSALDAFVEEARKLFSHNVDYKQLKNFLKAEEYDSISLVEDTKDNHQSDQITSNIIKQFINKPGCSAMTRYIRECSALNNSFQGGFTFYYWDYYWDYYRNFENGNEEKHLENAYNTHDHAGYSKRIMYIKQKYVNLKDEILNNCVYPLKYVQYEVSMIKAIEYMKTMKVKSLKAPDNWKVEDILHYGIKHNSALNLFHLLSIILYTDWTELCTQFSKTFRKTNIFESLLSVKERNSEFAIWSKTLRETIEYYGESRDGWYLLQGPFFCGMSFVMAMSEFNIRLCGPTSTSKQLAVATRFGGDEGMIMQLNNDGDYQSDKLCAFNCSWISNYNGEEEYLFVGGHHRIKIETIIDIKTNHNYGMFFKPLFLFDCMVNGSGFNTDNKPNISNKDYKILQNLIKHYLETDGYKNKYPNYINDTFKCFVNCKKTLIINLHEIDIFLMKLHDLILYSIARDQIIYSEQQQNKVNDKQILDMQNVDFSSSTMDKDNLFKPVIFKLFRNVKNISIYTSGQYTEYPFDLESLGRLIESCKTFIPKNVTIKIKATHYRQRYEDHKRSWLYTAHSLSMPWKFDSTVSLKETTGLHSGHRTEDILILSNLLRLSTL